jgi:hypothetical protein
MIVSYQFSPTKEWRIILKLIMKAVRQNPTPIFKEVI